MYQRLFVGQSQVAYKTCTSPGSAASVVCRKDGLHTWERVLPAMCGGGSVQQVDVGNDQVPLHVRGLLHHRWIQHLRGS